MIVLGLNSSVAQAREGDAPSLSGYYAPLLQSGSGRHYYLTEGGETGKNADEACTSGYHMASMWEILDVSNLIYETELGDAEDDTGEGPPTSWFGWIRTGYTSSGDSTPGKGNCRAWSNDDRDDHGTFAYLPDDWTWTGGSNIGAWKVGALRCDYAPQVWCVED